MRAAITLFNRKGYAATSVREIVEAAGLTKPALYYHFGSKEGVFEAVLRRAREEFARSVAASAEDAGSARRRIHAFAQRIFTLSRRHLEVVRLLHSTYYGPHGATPPFDFHAMTRPMGQALERLVREGMATGELRATGVEDAVRALEGAMHACMEAELAQVEPMPGPEGLGRTLDVVLDGLMGGKEQAS